MAEPENGAQPEEQKQPSLQVLGQFIRDMSFENVAAQKAQDGNIQPDIQVQVNLDARQREKDQNFEVIIKLHIESKNTETKDPVFILEIEYGGVFHIENVPADQMHPFLLIECPRMIFPFLRRIVSDITRDGGYPPLNLESIDFLAMYRAELARRAEMEQQGGTVA